MLAHLKRWESVETKSPRMALIRKRLRVEMWMYDQVRGYHHLVWFSIVCILYHHHYTWFYIFSSSSRLSTLRKGRQKLRLTSMRYDRRDKSPLVMFYPLNLYKRCTGWFFSLVRPIFSTKMKNKLQPTRTSFSQNFQCKKAPRWLSKFFSFWYWKLGGPVKKTTLYIQEVFTNKTYRHRLSWVLVVLF